MSPKTKSQPRSVELAGKAVDEGTLAILRQMEFEGAFGRIPRQLDRAEYVAVNKVLEAVGGQWNRKAKAHVFETASARDAVEVVLESGHVVDPKQYYQFFETPPELAKSVVELAEIHPGFVILEPSAGKGALCSAIQTLQFDSLAVHAIELDPRHEEVLRNHPQITHATISDFLLEPPRPQYDRVIMNPPFSRQQDIDHVLHAHRFLLPHGKLVAIMSPGFTYRSNRKSTEFLAFVHKHNGIIRENPPEAFKASGTTVNTVTVVLDNENV